MANAVATLTVNAFPYGADETQRRSIRYGVCALSAGGTYIANGIPLNWSFTQPDGAKVLVLTDAAQAAFAEFFSMLASGYTYVYDTTHNTLRIFVGITELAAGATITPDTIGFKAEWARGI